MKAAAANPVYLVFVGGLITFCFGLVGKIVFSWLNGRRTARVPRAGNGFLTLSEIQAHCAGNHGTFKKLMKAEFKAILIEIQLRLKSGDDKFDTLEGRIKGIEGTLEAQSGLLGSINKNVDQIARNGANKPAESED